MVLTNLYMLEVQPLQQQLSQSNVNFHGSVYICLPHYPCHKFGNHELARDLFSCALAFTSSG